MDLCPFDELSQIYWRSMEQAIDDHLTNIEKLLFVLWLLILDDLSAT